ncbi:hypothetical protein BDF19DRAFT_423365 [Syncephalis fuscata]|nr:hypothetical protein BDF19DRAFT_423365 [Syncephalis fuscata]
MFLTLDNIVNSNSSKTAQAPCDSLTTTVTSGYRLTKRKIASTSHASTSIPLSTQSTKSTSEANSLIQTWRITRQSLNEPVINANSVNILGIPIMGVASGMPSRKRRKSIPFNKHCNIPSTGTTIDFLAPEILVMIFQSLQQPEDLRACESTCRQWRKIIVPILWRAPQIYFTPLLDERTRTNKPSLHLPPATAKTDYSIRVRARRPLDSDFVPVNIPLAKHGQWIRQLDLWPAYSMIRDATVLRFMSNCTNLRSISLHGCIFVTDISIGAIAEACGKTLSTINLSYCVRVTDNGIAAIAQHASHALEQINLKGCSRISDNGLRALSACRSIRRIRLAELPEVTDIGVWALAQGCPRLEWIDLTGTCGCSDATAEALGKFCSKLGWLSMARIPSITPESIAQQDPNNTAVFLNNGSANQSNESTAISANNNLVPSMTGSSSDNELPPRVAFSIHQKRSITNGLTDRGLDALATGCPKLTFLDLSFHHRVTDCGVERLARSAQHLVHVALIGCTRATTRSLYALVELRHRYGRMACITMGGTPQLDEATLREATAGPSALLKDWKRADADGYATRDLPGISWLDTW